MQPIGPHHWPEDAASVLAYYRADQRRHLLRTWVASITLVYSGCGLTILASLRRPNFHAGAYVLGVIGVLTVALGLFRTIRGLARGLCSDRYISLRRDGLVVRLDGAPLLIDWDELEEVRHDGDTRSVLLVLRNGQALQLTDRYTDVNADELARQIATIRRRALWGYYRMARRAGDA